MIPITADLNAAVAWLALGQQVLAGGEALWTDIKGVLAQHGVNTDNAALDVVIADAARRKAIAEQDAAGGAPLPPSPHVG